MPRRKVAGPISGLVWFRCQLNLGESVPGPDQNDKDTIMITQTQGYRLLSPRLYGTVAQTPTHPEESLQNVNERPLFDGSLCMVGSVPVGPGGLFVLSKASALVIDNLNILPTYSGTGRWIRVSWNPVSGQAREMASWDQFGQVLIPAGTLEAAPVTIETISVSIVPLIGYSANYLFEATAAIFGVCTYKAGTTSTAGMKFLWDLDGDGTFETAGARIENFFLDDSYHESLVLRERRTVPYASLGVIQLPAVRLVGWDPTTPAAGWATAINAAGGPQPNSLEFVYGNA